MDFQRIITELLGQGAAPGGTAPGGQARGPQTGAAGGFGSLLSGLGGGGSLSDIVGRLRPPMGGAAGAAAAGGLLGSLLGGRGGGGLLRMGGMAVVGLLAHRAYEQWKAQQPGQPATPAAGEFVQAGNPDAAAQPFVLALVQAMAAAAHADGTLDPQERERIFTEAERMNLAAEDKAEIFRILNTQSDPEAIALLANTDAQRAELYTASGLIIGEAGAAERAYLDALAGALELPEGLRHRLDAQLREALALPAH